MSKTVAFCSGVATAFAFSAVFCYVIGRKHPDLLDSWINVYKA